MKTILLIDNKGLSETARDLIDSYPHIRNVTRI